MHLRLALAAVLCLPLCCATTPAPARTGGDDDDLAPEGAMGSGADEQSAEQICAGGAGDMCSALADHAFRKAKTDADRQRALGWAQKGCALGDGAGCSIAGWALEWGKAGAPDPARALASYEAGCALSDGRSCVKAASLRAFGPLPLRDRPQALTLASRACAKASEAEGCGLEAKLKAEPRAPSSNECQQRSSSGELSKEQIAEVIRWHSAEIRDCFDRALQRTPELSGRVEVAWTIGCAGAVTAPRTAESSLPKDVSECVLGNVRLWRFPAPRGGGPVAVSFPWVLKPKAGR